MEVDECIMEEKKLIKRGEVSASHGLHVMQVKLYLV
jgi:hypothetical protein